VAELAQRFLAEYDRPKLRNRAQYIKQTAAAFHQRLNGYPLATMPATSVRRLDVERHRNALVRDGYMPATVNDALVRLSLVYRWANDQEIIDCKNPCSRVERMNALPSEECYTRSEVERLLSPEYLDPLVAVALYGGLRCGEIAGLTWDCVRFDLGRLEIKRSFAGPTKNGKPRTIPLHPELVPILRDWQARCPESSERLVFPSWRAGRWTMHAVRSLRYVREILQRAGCTADFERPWHAMRRTFATLFSESDGSRDALEQILGHTTSGNRITARYVLPSMAYLAREMAKLTLRPTPPAKIYAMADYRAS
jgi:integrase